MQSYLQFKRDLNAMRICLILTSLFFTLMGTVQAEPFDQNHSVWASVLNEVVTVSGSQSQVDYRGLSNSHPKLAQYLEQLSSVTNTQFEGFSRANQIAFLINSYNAFTLKLVTEHYPVRSIRNIKTPAATPWKHRFLKLLGEMRHLDEVEHELLRPRFKEPRVHFALVCAAKGCPMLDPKPYLGSTLEAQLDLATRRFIRDKERNRFNADQRLFEISSIFDWFKEDFGTSSEAVAHFVARYLDAAPSELEQLRSGKIRITYLDYDWDLNE